MKVLRVRWAVVAAVTLVAAAITTILLWPDVEPVPASSSTTTTVRRGEVTFSVSAAGTVESLQSRRLSFSTGGTITALTVKAGDVVAAGAVLAKVDDTDAQEAIENAQERVDSAEEAVNNASTSTSVCVETASWQSPSPTTSASPTPIPSPTQTPTQTTAPRPTNPAPTPTGPTDCGGGGNSRNGSADALMSAQQQLNDARLQLRQAQTRLAGTVITAPVAGKVLSVGGTIGATTQAGSAIIVLAGTADVAVRAGFTEAEVASLAAGQSARVTLPDRPSAPLTGRVIQVDPAGTVSNRLVTYAALIAFDQVPDGLLYGQSATVVVVTNSAVDVLYVPSTAITDLDGSRGTVAVRTNNQDVRRSVEIGLRGDTTTEIRDGLTEGEEVLTGAGS